MQQPSAAPPSAAAAAYAKVEKMDAEEARHLRAQYLIRKVLEEAATPAPARRPPALARARARIGVRLKKLRLAIRSLMRRLAARGAPGPGSSVRPAPEPSS